MYPVLLVNIVGYFADYIQFFFYIYFMIVYTKFQLNLQQTKKKISFDWKYLTTSFTSVQLEHPIRVPDKLKLLYCSRHH